MQLAQGSVALSKSAAGWSADGSLAGPRRGGRMSGRVRASERGREGAATEVGGAGLAAVEPGPRRLASVPMAAVDRLVGRRLLQIHQRLYELTGGRWGHRLGRRSTLLLRTTGRKSGQQRTAALLYHEDGDQLIVVGSKGGSDTPPAW